MTTRQVGTRGVSVGGALAAPWVARRNRAENGAVTYQESVGAGVAIILCLSVLEIVLVDLVLDTLWVRLVAAAAGIAAGYLLIGFSMALSAYPHQVANGRLRIRYGATFAADVNTSLITSVSGQRRGGDYRRTAEVIDGALIVPVMGVTNVLVALDSPVEMELRKNVISLQEIRFFATEPETAVQLVRAAIEGTPPVPPQAPSAPDAESRPQVPGWLRRLRWAGLLILLAEIVLVTSGILDWRIAAGILAVTEGTLAVLGVVYGAAFVSQYRNLRRVGVPRAEAFSSSFFALLPPPMAELVRREMSIFRVIALAAARRTERSRLGGIPLGYGRDGRRVSTVLAVLLATAGAVVLATVSPTLPRYVVGVPLLYGALLTAAMAAASSTRPHVSHGGALRLRWGLHQELVVPIETLEEVRAEPSKSASGQDGTPDVFLVPCQGRGALVLRLASPVEVPTRLGSRRPAMTVVAPVDAAEAARDIIARAMQERSDESC
ncbi:hypothetical protein ABZ383_14525 [Streptomyces sp. NPDC005900]|uniref:hypothetical protein n=1 Tax=Streptomyces sp. NPDC005900 TaxID=3154569 RepID=UPI0033F619BB